MSAPASSDDGQRDVEQEIAWVLDHPGMSGWLKTALRTALECDPVQVSNDLEMLRVLLQPRTDAIVRRRLGVDDEPWPPDGLVREPSQRSSR